MWNNKQIQSFGEFKENLNISDVSDSNSKIFQDLALKYYSIVTKIKKPFVDKVSFSKNMIVYHGGGFITEQNIRVPIFTTNDPDIAKWYGCTNIRGIGNTRTSDGIGYITTLNIKVENPLLLKGLDDFKNYWIPLLNETGLKYNFKEFGNTYTFSCDEIEKNYGANLSPLDLVYIPDFMNIVKIKYDTIIGLDNLSNGKIQTNIPLFIENVDFIKCEEIF